MQKRSGFSFEIYLVHIQNFTYIYTSQITHIKMTKEFVKPNVIPLESLSVIQDTATGEKFIILLYNDDKLVVGPEDFFERDWENQPREETKQWSIFEIPATWRLVALAADYALTKAERELVMWVQPLTLEEMLEHDNKEYNPYEWRKTVSRFAKYKDCKFYERVAPKPKMITYHELFAVYTIEEGIRLIKSVSYGGCLTNNAFAHITIEGDEAVYRSAIVAGGQKGYIRNDKEGRKYMATLSSKLGYIFSNDL